jgi:hypothetical protein
MCLIRFLRKYPVHIDHPDRVLKSLEILTLGPRTTTRDTRDTCRWWSGVSQRRSGVIKLISSMISMVGPGGPGGLGYFTKSNFPM